MTLPQRPAPFPPGRGRILPILVPVLAGLAILGYFAIAWYSLSAAHAAALREAALRAQSLAQVAEERSARIFQAVDLMLSAVGDSWTRDPAVRDSRNPHLQGVLRARMAPLPFARGMYILDAGGAKTHDVDAPAIMAGDFSDHEYFTWHRTRTGALYIGRAVRSQETGDWTLPVSRRLSTGDGSFSGVVVVTLDIAALQSLYRDLDAGHDGAIEVLHANGELIGRVPEASKWLGMPTGIGITLRDFGAGMPGRMLRASSALDGVARVYNVRPVAGAALMVQAGVSEHEALAAWRERRTAASATIVILILVTIVLAWLLMRELRRSQLASGSSLADSLRESEARYRALFRNSIDAILLMHPDGVILAANDEACRMLDFTEAELRKLGRERIFDMSDTRMASLMDELSRNGSARGEFRMCRKDGSKLPVELSAAMFDDRAGRPCASMIIRDITERRRAEEHIEYLAYHDELTGIPNRAHFQREFEHAISVSQRHGLNCALMLVDLDRFKIINDTMGHQAGDLLLKQMAARLRACLRDSDIICRLGGDEFVILMQDASNMQAVTAVAEKILEVASRPLVIDDQEFLITASIGISTYPRDGADLQTLLKSSDLAMYRAKEAGKNAFRYFSPEMNVHSRRRMEIESALRVALDRGEFAVYYQPKIRLSSRSIAGMEALLRWRHPERGLLSPGDFIAIAEETGLIVSIGDWVMEEACRTGQAMREAGRRDLRVAVNLSARQLFDGELARRVADILDHTGFPAQNLELEITESMVMQDAEQAVGLLTALHGTGVRIAIDDFGTGYSSLAYLKRFPIDCVKIDRSFIRDLPDNRDDVSITRSIIAMAHNMKLEVVAEGVETAQQAEFLHDNGCDEIQGFLFSEPLPADRLQHFLDRAHGNVTAFLRV